MLEVPTRKYRASLCCLVVAISFPTLYLVSPCWIPFEDHPIQLERYREDFRMAPAQGWQPKIVKCTKLFAQFEKFGLVVGYIENVASSQSSIFEGMIWRWWLWRWLSWWLWCFYLGCSQTLENKFDEPVLCFFDTFRYPCYFPQVHMTLRKLKMIACSMILKRKWISPASCPCSSGSLSLVKHLRVDA